MRRITMISAILVAALLVAFLLAQQLAVKSDVSREVTNAVAEAETENVSEAGPTDAMADANSTDGPTSNSTSSGADTPADGRGSSAPGSAGPTWCAAANDSLPAIECATLTAYVDHLKIGEAGFIAPKQMYVGDTDTIRFGITGKPKEVQLAAVLDEAPAPQNTGQTKVARRMAAELGGVGFEISPSGSIERDLAGTDQAVWEWQVKALDGASHKLDLSLYAVFPEAPGATAQHLIRVFHREIPVRIRWGDWLKRSLNGIKDWITSLTGILEALGGLIAAFIAVRAKLPQGIWARLKRLWSKPQP